MKGQGAQNAPAVKSGSNTKSYGHLPSNQVGTGKQKSLTSQGSQGHLKSSKLKNSDSHSKLQHQNASTKNLQSAAKDNTIENVNQIGLPNTRMKMMPTTKSFKMLKNSSTKKITGANRTSSSGTRPSHIPQTTKSGGGKVNFLNLKLSNSGSPMRAGPEVSKAQTTKNIKLKL